MSTQEKPSHEVQKMSWKESARFDNHADAKKFQMATDQKGKPTKIRMRKNGFSVMVGTPLKKENKKRKKK